MISDLLLALEKWFVPPAMPPTPGLPFGIGGKAIGDALAAAWKGCYFAGVRDGAVAGAVAGAAAAFLLMPGLIARLAKPGETNR